MPFTPAHPAIVLPLLKNRRFSATALIVGCMSPDFEYFFKGSVSSTHSHTIAGIFYFDLPVTIFLSFLFHSLVKQNLIANLHPILQRKLHPTTQLNFVNHFRENMLVVVTSALLGATSHVVWDSFTHKDAYLVRHLEIYKQAYIPFDGVNYPLFYALQHTSTFVGLAAILTYIFFMPQDFGFQPNKIRWLYWLALILLTSFFYYLRFWWYSHDYAIGNMVVTGMSAFMLSMCISGTIKYFGPGPQHV